MEHQGLAEKVDKVLPIFIKISTWFEACSEGPSLIFFASTHTLY
jgi:hypothetical protein